MKKCNDVTCDSPTCDVMPRRKGISHKQRSAQSVKQQQQRKIQEIIQEKRKQAEQQEQEQRQANNEGRKKKTENDVAVGNGVQRTIGALTNHVNNQDGGNRYLHKKFKKVVDMEETAAEAAAAAAAAPGPPPVVALASPVVNGYPPSAPPAPAASSATAGDTPCAAPNPTPTAVKTASSVMPERSTNWEAGAGLGVGRHVCPYCNLSCAKPSVLEKHIRAHTNERPYPCQPCGISFKTKSNLYKHCRSRAHTLKLEEDGADPSKFPQVPAEGEDEVSSDGEDGAGLQDVHGADLCLDLPAATPSSALPGHAAEHLPEPVPRNIYKPKFHPAAFQYSASAEKENERRPASTSGSESGTVDVAASLVLGQPGLPLPTPSPESVQRHISKLILENEAIMETTDPLWPKKYGQRASGSPVPAPAPTDSPAPSAAPAPPPSPSSVWHKKYLYRQVSGGCTTAEQQAESERNSKLALALMGPKAALATTPPPAVPRAVHADGGGDGDGDAEAPLNLSKPDRTATSNGTLDLTQPHLKRPAPPPPQPQPHPQPHHLHQPQPQQQPQPPPAAVHHQVGHLHAAGYHVPVGVPAAPHPLHHPPLHQALHHHQPPHMYLHHQSPSASPLPPPADIAPAPASAPAPAPAPLHVEQDSAFQRLAVTRAPYMDSHQAADGSVIKDILLKSRAQGLPFLTAYDGTHPIPGLPLLPPVLPPGMPGVHHVAGMVPEDASYLVPGMTTYQCHGCKAHYRSSDTLRKHMMTCSKAFTHPRPPSAAELTPPRHGGFGSGSVMPPQPSPGPLLGNTPLVDSYNHREPPPFKKRRLDSGRRGRRRGPRPTRAPWRRLAALRPRARRSRLRPPRRPRRCPPRCAPWRSCPAAPCGPPTRFRCSAARCRSWTTRASRPRSVSNPPASTCRATRLTAPAAVAAAPPHPSRWW